MQFFIDILASKSYKKNRRVRTQQAIYVLLRFLHLEATA